MVVHLRTHFFQFFRTVRPTSPSVSRVCTCPGVRGCVQGCVQGMSGVYGGLQGVCEVKSEVVGNFLPKCPKHK